MAADSGGMTVNATRGSHASQTDQINDKTQSANRTQKQPQPQHKNQLPQDTVTLNRANQQNASQSANSDDTGRDSENR